MSNAHSTDPPRLDSFHAVLAKPFFLAVPLEELFDLRLCPAVQGGCIVYVGAEVFR